MVTGYRSPLRPIPKDAIPDATVFFGSVGNNGDSADENIDCQLVENGEEHVILYGDESITDSCKKDGWWLEAVRAAEQIENMNKTLDLSETEKTSDGDDEWWMEVERSTFQAELTYL
ncbi:hypothetical protein U1Q18_004641 [Sarracenia purpurea var. burkii]